MNEDPAETKTDFASLLGPALAGAIEKKGFTALTSIQETVLDPALAGRDLRITSQTGSGKTVALGLALRDLVAGAPPSERGIARPRALVVAPTRELAKQVEEELSWLYAPLGARVASATGGANLRDERRALGVGPAVVVGTPGRLLDHLDRGAIDPSATAAVVLDEADRLLDMGFREELERILAHVPEQRRTHLVSATFPREVRALADAVQNDPIHVEGTRLGEANADIDHVLHLVDARDRFGAIVNLLLANPDEQMLIFARTRADVADIADALVSAGFSASSLSGEMEQPARDRALAAFKRGDLRALVATDVAARGIDVQDIGRVLHADPPGDADAYTHRSGRTGRAGRKGISSVLVPPSVMARVIRIIQRAGVTYRFEKVPGAEAIRRANDDRLVASLVADPTEADADAHIQALAARLAASADVPRAIARLLQRIQKATGPEPVPIRVIEPPSQIVRATRRNTTSALSHDPRRPFPRPDSAPGDEAQAGTDGEPYSDHLQHSEHEGTPARPRRAPRPPGDPAGGWALFQISWGEVHGADTRRMLAMLCRRGGIESGDVGAIRIGRIASTVEIAAEAAPRFAESAGKVDARDPRIVIRPFAPGAPRAQRPQRRPDGDRPSWRPAPDTDHPSWRPAARDDHPSWKPPADSEPAAPPAAKRRPAPAGPPAHPKKKPHAKEAVSVKTKGWVKKPSPRATRAGDAPPKRRRVV
jgi:ATP-dependent RNA helicase DeaD